jgi:sugar lactone lactonase YvrE
MRCSTRRSERSTHGSASMRPERSAFALAIAASLAGLACGSGQPAITECAAAGPLTPVCQFQNPEDLAVVGDWILVSQFPAGEKAGSLVAFRPSDATIRPLYPLDGDPSPRGACAEGVAPEPAEFAPHGIDLAGTTLLVVNHGSREAIEEFALGADGDGPTLAWTRCTALPDDASANDVAALNNGGFVATKMLQRPQWLGMLKLAFGGETGALLRHPPGDGEWEIVPNTAGRGPNGVEEAPDGMLYVAEWAAQRLVRVAPDGSGRTEIPLDFSPDNLSWAGDGRLLVAGQRAAVLEVPSCLSVDHGTCPLASVVAAVDPRTLAVTKLVDEDPAATIGAASVAVEHGGALWIGTFAGDRIVRREGTH